MDVRYALRALRKSPVFTLVALLTLTLGIGANVVVFGVLNAVLLRPLDVSDPQNLYQLRHQQWTSFKLLTTSYPAFKDFQQRNTTFSGIAGFYGYSQARLTWRNAVKSVSGYYVTGNYFDLLGVQPEVGRFFHTVDERGPNSAPYVVLSHNLWRNVFLADPGVVGTTVELNKHPFTVIGVAPERFHGTEQFVWPDYWIPMVNEEQVEGQDYLHSRTTVAVTVIGRLNPGVTPQQAAENLNAIAAELAKEYPETDKGLSLRLIRPGLYGDTGDVVRGFLYSVTVLALLVLAAACANLASLFAARAADRSRELALWVALGASRWRLVRHLMTEALVVSLMGGAAGLVTASLLLGVLNRLHLPYGHLAVSLDARVYLAGLTLTLASALLFGMVPARQVWQSSPLQAMKGGSVDSTPLRRFALRDLLLVAQIAICTLLVTASLVAVCGMVRMLHAPLGFQPQGAMLAGIDLSQVEQEGDTALEKKKAMLEAVRSIPGAAAAGTVSRVPFTGGLRGIPIFRPGTTDFNLNNSVLAPYVFTISPGYLEAAGTRLLGGRDVSWHDTTKTPYVAIVNETFARKMWGETPAIGQRFIVWGQLTEVVGVVEDGKYHDMHEPPQPVAYLPLSQNGQSAAVFVVRSHLAQNEMAAALERTLSGLEPNAPITVQSWSDALGGALFPARAATAALGVIGLLAAMLAATGIFGMAAYNVRPPDERTGHSRRIGREQDTRYERGGGAANGAAWSRIVGGAAVGLLRQRVTGADCVSGESSGSCGRGRRGANNGAAGHCSVRHSSPAGACRRSIQTHEGRMRQVNTLQAGGGSAMDEPRIGYVQKRRKRHLMLAACGLVLVAVVIAFVSRLKPAVPSVARNSVWIDTVRQGSFLREVRGIGTLVPKEIRWIASRNDARVEKILVWPGTPVQPDTIILSMTNPELQQTVVDADGAVTASQAKLVNLRAQLEGQLLERKAAMIRAEGERDAAAAELDVNERLSKKGLIAAVDLKKSQITAREFQATFDIEKQRFKFMQNAIDPQLAIARGELDQARAQARLRHDQLDALQVRAGMTGVLQQIAVEIGQRISAGTNVARVANSLKLKADVRIPETQARDIVIGQPATIDTRASGLVKGRVSRIDPAVQQGTVLVDVDFDDQQLPRGARPDLSVEGTIQLETLENVTYVGRPAFGQDESTIYLFKIVGNGLEAERTRVLLGRGSANAIEIRQGLNPGDQVILSDISANDNHDKIRLQ